MVWGGGSWGPGLAFMSGTLSGVQTQGYGRYGRGMHKAQCVGSFQPEPGAAECKGTLPHSQPLPSPPSPRNLHSGGNRESYRRGLYSRDFKKELWREASENALLVERQMLGPLSTWYPRDGKVPGCSGAPWVELMLWS